MTNKFEKISQKPESEFIEPIISLNEAEKPEPFPGGKENEIREGFSFYIWREDKEIPGKSGWEYITTRMSAKGEEQPTLSAVNEKQFNAWNKGRIIALPSALIWSDEKKTWDVITEQTEDFKEYGVFDRVFFFDVDGVLIGNEPPFNTYETHEGFIKLNPERVQAVKRVVETYGGQIVISSSWRQFVDWRERFVIIFKKCGWENPPIIGRTAPIDEEGEYQERGQEIKEWIDKNPTRSYVILDDMTKEWLPEQEENLILCDPATGFSEDQARAIEKLWKKKNN